MEQDILERARAMFREEESFSEKTFEAFKETIEKGWLTRQYFSRGKYDLVLPAWLLGILGPAGEARGGIAGAIDLNNTDLRSYYALGSPRSEEEPVVDHRGGVIPLPESYTIIFGTVIDGRPFYSSEVGEIEVEYVDGFPITTIYWKVDGDTMVYDVFADRDEEGNEALGINVVRGFANHPLLVTLCPIDQDSITDISEISYDSNDHVVEVKGQPPISISEVPIRVTALPISEGHAGRLVTESTLEATHVKCPASLASWAAQFPVRATPMFNITLHGEVDTYQFDMDDVLFDWEDLVFELPKISTSNEEVDYYFKASAAVLRLLADVNDATITVGPSVQERMWIPALLFQTRALDRLGFSEEVVRPVLENLHSMIDSNGLVTDDQQWASQGAIVIALINHFYKTGDATWIGDKYSAIKRIAEWVTRQRKNAEEREGPEVSDGLISVGNASWFDPLYWKLDYFYSHNFWSMAILENTISLARQLGRHSDAEKYTPELDKFKQDVDDSITTVTGDLSYLPAGPFQRDNAQMIFNLHAFYPLKLYLPAFQALNNTTHWLWENYTHEGGLLIDQPWNAYGSYFSILLAQAFRYIGENEPIEEIIEFMVDNATNDSGWAEGISPLTRKGSVGDSPNGYAAAEWVNLILDLFAEDNGMDAPILLKGMPQKWLENGVEAENLQLFHDSTLSLSAKLDGNTLNVDWEYENPEIDLYPIIHLPKPAVSIPRDVEQISTLELQVNSQSGSISIELEENS